MVTKQRGFATAPVLAIVMTVLFVVSLIISIWAFVGLQQNKSSLDEKVESAAAIAIERTKAEKEAEFTEREKYPYKNYTGSQTYGSLSFNYPKSWSAYAEDGTSGTILDFYAQPDVVAGTKSGSRYALRAQILSTSYQSEVDKYTRLADSSKVSIGTFRAGVIPEVLGVKISGEINTGVQGVMILLPQRDKTFKIWTESQDYVSDFDTILSTLTFVP